MKTYLCGKIGKSVKFNPSTWSAIGGDGEAPTLIKRMAELNPADQFIIISRNDSAKTREVQGLPDNLISVYDGSTKEERSSIGYVWEKLKDKAIDGCFLMSGPSANINIPNTGYKRRDLIEGKKVFALTLQTFQNYVAPTYMFLNESNIPWVMIANDPRYIGQGNDLINQPKKILSQFDETILMKQFDNFEDQNYINNLIQSEYAGMEKMCLIGSTNDDTTHEKTEKFLVVLNEGNNGVKSRYSELKKYVLDYIDDVHVYGKWQETTVAGDTRFKGSVKFEDLQTKLKHVKYTFIIPIKPGWVTAKWVEMISNGIIPFFHPDYDTQLHCKVPSFLRITNPNELHERIEELENDPQKYKDIISACIALITQGDISGETLSQRILINTPTINKLGTTINNYVKEETLGEW